MGWCVLKDSAQCRAPHINVDVWRDEMHKAGVLRMVDLGKAGGKKAGGIGAGLLQWSLRLNDALVEWDAKDDPRLSAMSRVNSEAAYRKALDKARTHRFFLGLVDFPGLLSAATQGRIEGLGEGLGQGKGEGTKRG